MAFAYRPEASLREIIAGINFSPAIDNPFERLGYFESLLNILDDQYIKVDDPVVLAMHYASPVPNFSDRGKSALILPDEVKEEIIRHVKPGRPADLPDMPSSGSRGGVHSTERRF